MKMGIYTNNNVIPAKAPSDGLKTGIYTNIVSCA